MPRKKKTAVSIQDLSIEELNQEIERRHEEAAALEEERNELIVRIDEIDAMLEEISSIPSPTKRSGGRARTTGRNHSKKTASRTGTAADIGVDRRQEGTTIPDGASAGYRLARKTMPRVVPGAASN